MKKKVFVGILAALMLFAFVACDGGTSGSYIVGAAVDASEHVYLPGEAFNPADYQFYSVSYDGTKTPVSGSEFTFDEDVIGDNTQYILGYYQGNKDWGVLVPVKLGTVSEIEITADPTKVSYFTATSDSTDEKYTNDSITLAGATIVATYKYDGVEDTRELDPEKNEELTASIQNWTTAEKTTVKVEYVNSTSDTYEVTLEANRIDSVAMKTTDDYVLYTSKLGVSTSNDSFAYAEFGGDGSVTTPGIYMEATYQNGETAVVEAADVLFQAENGALTEATISDVDLKHATNFIAKYNGDEGKVGFVAETAPITVNVQADYVKDIKVSSVPETIKAANYDDTDTYATKAAAVKTMFGSMTVNPVYASGDSTATLDYDDENNDGNGYTVVEPTAWDFSKMIEGQWIEFTISGFVGDTTDLTKTFEIKVGSGT